MKTQRNNRRGYTLTELLAAIAILLLLTAAVATAMPTAARTYRTMTDFGESGVLCSTLMTTLSDELRYGTDFVQKEEGLLQFSSEAYGSHITLTTQEDGKVYLGEQAIFSDTVYQGMRVELSATLSTDYITLIISVYRDTLLLQNQIMLIEPLNGI